MWTQAMDTSPLIFHLKSMSGLWYHSNAHEVTDYPSWSTRLLNGPVLHQLTKAAEYALAHLLVHHDVDNQQKLRMHGFF